MALIIILAWANHLEVKRRAIEAVKKYGVGSGGVRWLSGTMDIHQKMERVLANFTYQDDALTTGTGFGTNTGLIPAIINLLGFKVKVPFLSKEDVIISDELNHASIIDGCALSHAKAVVYKHKNMADLERKLDRYKRRRKLIVTDTVFSMDGDIAPLDRIVELAKEYKAMVMVDDAHATGILGKHGGGGSDYFGLEGKIDINMGTSKTFGALGGFIAGNKDLIDYLRVACRSYLFATSMPPLIAAAILASVKIIKNEPELRDRLHKNADYLRDNLKRLGFNTLESETAIIPVLLGEEQKAIKANKLFFEKGIFAPTVRWPAVAKGQSRVRFVVMATHTREQIDYLLECCKEIGKRLGVV